MADIALIKKLRAQTHAPLKDVKAALEEVGDDIDAAKERLRKKGLSKAAKKADRETNEWRLAYVQDGNVTVVAWVACETDFVAKNDDFVSLVDRVVAIVAEQPTTFASKDDLGADVVETKITPVLHEAIASIGENLQLAAAYRMEWPAYVYVHAGNKLVSVVQYEGDEAAAKQVALQVAAMNPSYLCVEDVPQEAKDAYADELRKADDLASKPADIQEKIIAGRMQKYYDEIVLLEQPSIVDDTKRVKDALGNTTVTAYYRFSI